MQRATVRFGVAVSRCKMCKYVEDDANVDVEEEEKLG